MSTGPTGANFLPPPKTLQVQMHYFTTSPPRFAPDPVLPPSLQTVLDTLPLNQYLVRCDLLNIQTISAWVYNPGANGGAGGYVQYYDAYSCDVGEWIAVDATGYTWQILQIYNITDCPNEGLNTSGNTFYALMEDVDGYNAGMDQNGTFNGAPGFEDTQGLVFTVDEDGFPIFTPADSFVIAQNFSANVISRFRALNTYNQYISVGQTGAAATFQVGDPVGIDGGVYIKTSGVGALVAKTIGIVTSVGVPNDDFFTFNPFGEYRTTDDVGTGFTGPIGTIWYVNTNPLDSAPFTTTAPATDALPMYQVLDNSGNVIILAGGASLNGAVAVEQDSRVKQGRQERQVLVIFNYTMFQEKRALF